MKTFLFLLFSLIALSSFSKTIIFGKVVDKKQVPLPGVNIFIEGSYDGCSSKDDGSFSFQTDAEPTFSLKASFIGYRNWTKSISQTGEIRVEIVMEESLNTIEAVTITAGVFAAADKKRASILEPLDIYTTASANGDVMAAMRTMPGTQVASDDGRLMVRGGDAYETKTYIDGVLAAKPYYSKTPDVATRGRFAPSLFNGVMFNSGGYSAEYGQALSSVLVLNTTDVAETNNTGLSLMSIGGEASQTLAMDNSSLMLSAGYTNLYLNNALIHSNLNWTKPVESVNLSGVYRYKPTSDALLKVYSTYDWGTLKYEVPGQANFSVENTGTTSYTNVHYQDCLTENSCYQAGVAVTYDNQMLVPGSIRLNDQNLNVEGRFSMTHILNDGVKFSWGVSETYTNNQQQILLNESSSEINLDVEDHTLGVYAETEIHLSKGLAFRPGVRAEHASVLGKSNVAPRLALALKTGKNSQLSAAWGQYYQNPETDYLKYNTKLGFEQATHYVVSYQAGSVKERLFRTELYHKQYDNLILWDGISSYNPQNIRNGGQGYATGIDLFWRDRKSVRRLDYWITYSWIDTKRQYQNYPVEVMPSFVARHTFSTVAKYWVNAISTQFGASFSMASGRNYNDLNADQFMDGRTKPFSDLSLNMSKVFYLGDQYSVFYCSITNVLGRENIVGYRSSFDPNENGDYAMFPLRDDTKRFVFVGLFLNF